MSVDPYEEERQRSLQEYERRERKAKVVRVSDSERERAVAQLRRHLAEGRIDLEEFTERMDLVLQAKTNLDIDKALHELPFVSASPALTGSGVPERRQIAPFAPTTGHGGQGLARHSAAFALASGVVFAVTAFITLLAGGGWFALVVLLPMAAWAVALFVQAMREFGRGDDR